MESTTRTKDARHLVEIEKLKAIARNEHESLETMIQTLEQQLQQKKDRTDRFITDWQNWGMNGGTHARRSEHPRTNGKPKIKTEESTFDF